MIGKPKKGMVIMFSILAILVLTLVSLVSAIDTTKTETNSILYNTRTQKAIGEKPEITRQYIGKNEFSDVILPDNLEKENKNNLFFTIIFPPTCGSWPTCESHTCINSCSATYTCVTCGTSCSCTNVHTNCFTNCPNCPTTSGNTCSTWC